MAPVFTRGDELPKMVASEAGDLIAKLKSAGWSVEGARYDPESFGNWYIDLACGPGTLRILKDRGQFSIEGPSQAELQPFGLWKSFDRFDEFRDVIANWIGSHSRAKAWEELSAIVKRIDKIPDPAAMSPEEVAEVMKTMRTEKRARGCHDASGEKQA